MTRLLRAIHLLCAALAFYASWQMARQSYQLQLDNLKAASFALQIFAEHPHAADTLLQQTFAVAALYLVVFWLIAVLGRPRENLHETWKNVAVLVLTWISVCWLILHCTLLIFPRSVWTWAVEPVMSTAATKIVDFLAAGWVVRRIYLLFRSPRRANRWLTLGALLAICAFVLIIGRWLYLHSKQPSLDPEAPSNIVVIGLDSLRRDIALSATSKMPNLAAFREKAFVQQNVVSPLARTFPAWATILTGESPATSGIRDNLVAQNDIGKSSIGWDFKKRGYRTIYATDETRFSNIGTEFGFDQVVSPHPGVADFLLGQFGDQPLVNWAIQVPFAEYLFPSLVGNRAFAHAYEPSRFIERLVDSIGPAGQQKTLLAVHLCIAHWPYFSASSPSNAPSPYLRAVKELDDQLGLLMRELHRLGYINNKTTIVLLADHGEGVSELRGPVASQTQYDVPVKLGPPMPGHGGTLLDPAQWQVFLMFAGHSPLGRIPPGSSDQLLSLQDLPYALQQLSGAAADAPYTMAVVNRTAELAHPEHGRPYVAMETGFGPKDFNLLHPDGEEALRIAESSFDIRDDGRVEMKRSVFLSTLLNKDYGVTDGKDVLAVINTGGSHVLVSTDTEKNRWDLFPVESTTGTVPVPKLLHEACSDQDVRSRISAWCQN